MRSSFTWIWLWVFLSQHEGRGRPRERICTRQIFVWWLDSFGRASGSSGTASQRATHIVESLSSDAHVRMRSLGPGFVLHITLACTAATGGRVLIRSFQNRGGKVTFCCTSQVSRVVRVSLCSAAMNFRSECPSEPSYDFTLQPSSALLFGLKPTSNWYLKSVFCCLPDKRSLRFLLTRFLISWNTLPHSLMRAPTPPSCGRCAFTAALWGLLIFLPWPF